MWLRHLQMIYRCIEALVFALAISMHKSLQSQQWCMKYHVLIAVISLGQFASLAGKQVQVFCTPPSLSFTNNS